jgi:hypothetical protein
MVKNKIEGDLTDEEKVKLNGIINDLDELFELNQSLYVEFLLKMFIRTIKDLENSEANLVLEQVKAMIYEETGYEMI